MAAESIREERNRLISEIAVRAERLQYLTDLLEQRFEVGRAGKVKPPPPPPPAYVPVSHAPPQKGNITVNGIRVVTQK